MAIPISDRIMNSRRHLSFDALIDSLRLRFGQIPDHRGQGMAIPLRDALMSALAMFSLKDASLLTFDGRRNDRNLKNVFRIGRIPSDTQMREILDPLDPNSLRDCFRDVFRQLQRGKVLERYQFYEGGYLLALDGTGYFSSQKVHCNSCLQKVNKRTGAVTYQHQMLGAVLIHPDHREVIPLFPEPIEKQDGDNKNDCERNAAKRLLRGIRRGHPRLKLIAVEDGLASNGPHIRDLKKAGMHFILVAKPGDHSYLFKKVIAAFEEDRVSTFRWRDGDSEFQVAFLNGVPLNEANQDLTVNFLQWAEMDADGNQRRISTWVTDLRIRRSNASKIVRGGRCRWKIENETFNTLKNQGYHFAHNYGHGEHKLGVVFAMLMMLAFLVDQVQQICSPLFNAVWEKLGSKIALWDNLRSHFRHFLFRSMRHLYETVLTDRAKEAPLPPHSRFLEHDTL